MMKPWMYAACGILSYLAISTSSRVGFENLRSLSGATAEVKTEESFLEEQKPSPPTLAKSCQLASTDAWSSYSVEFVKSLACVLALGEANLNDGAGLEENKCDVFLYNHPVGPDMYGEERIRISCKKSLPPLFKNLFLAHQGPGNYAENVGAECSVETVISDKQIQLVATLPCRTAIHQAFDGLWAPLVANGCSLHDENSQVETYYERDSLFVFCLEGIPLELSRAVSDSAREAKPSKKIRHKLSQNSLKPGDHLHYSTYYEADWIN